MEDILASIRRIIADDQSRSLTTGLSSFRRSTAVNLPVPPDAASSAIYDLPPPIGSDMLKADTHEVAAAPAWSPSEPTAQHPVRVDAPLDGEPSAIVVPHLNPPSSIDAPAPLSVIDEIANAGLAAIRQHDAAPPLEAVAAAGELADETAPAEAVDLDVAPLDLAAFATVPVGPRIDTAAIEAMIAEAAPAVEAAMADRPDEPDLSWEGGTPLLSPVIGATIESSFQALASSVFMQNTDMVETMMRDMLRPMLRNWLDDNLPTIVERLVRIEIERVARGGRA